MLKRLITDKMITFIISLSFFMEAVDGTVINTAIPAISASFSIDPVEAKIALLSYLLALAIFIPISGWLADKMGAKKIFMTALIVFTISSLFCGLATNLTELIIARFVQGVGGALGLPVGRLILIRTFGRENLIHTMNQVATIGALGMMLGPVIGGFITPNLSWHWIFLLNVPVGIVSITLAYYWLDNTKPQKVPALDKLGFILFGTALAGFTYGLSMLSELTINPITSLSVVCMSILMLIIYIWHSYHQLHPIVNIDIFRLKTFQISVLANLLSRMGFGGVPFLIPLLLQLGLGFSAQLSGLLLAPTSAGVLLAKPASIRLLRLFGYKRLLLINTVLAGLSIWSFILIDSNTSISVICILTLLYGFIVSLQYSAMNSLAYADIPSERLSAATSIMGTLQQVAQSFGVAASAIFIRLFSSMFLEDSSLTPLVFHCTFFSIGIITMISALLFFRLKKEDAQHMFA